MQQTDRQTSPCQWLRPTAVFDGRQIHHNMAVRITDGCICDLAISDDNHSTAKPIDGILTAGFFDIQVNGGGNVLFNNSPTHDGAAAIAGAHRKFGTTHLLPTVITDTPEIIDAACNAIVNCAGEHGIAGIHVEGPHISTARAGTHDKKRIRPLDQNTINSLQKLRVEDIPTLITVAPEAVAPGQITTLTEMGVIVSLGHSDATAEEVKVCLAEGATLFTHLYNAMSPMQGRAPGMVGTAINSNAYCSIIGDGRHVCPDMIQLAVNARPRNDRMILISDAMPTVGGNPEFTLYDETIRVVDGTLINASGSLAGAHISILQSIHYLLEHTSLSLEYCLQMSITHPAMLLGLEHLTTLQSTPIDDCIVLQENATGCAPLTDYI